jgi:hypothetical protein
MDSPEVEVMCGGINTKLPTHAALWRQGNLLHFGFEEAPSELNDNGRALLVNAIVYIARFTDDRAIARTPSVFVDQKYPKSRAYLARALASEKASASGLASHFGGALKAELAAMPVADLKALLKERLGLIDADESGSLRFDPDALALGIPLDTPELFERAIPLLEEGGKRAPAAARLLARHVPEGPGGSADAAAWKEWWSEHRDYVFFTERGGYRWHVDPVAKKRGVPSASLRGEARASR